MHQDALLSWCDKAFAHSVSAAVRRGFRAAIAEPHALGGFAHRHFLVLDFAQDEDEPWAAFSDARDPGVRASSRR
jgi:hypothetical protein